MLTTLWLIKLKNCEFVPKQIKLGFLTKEFQGQSGQDVEDAQQRGAAAPNGYVLIKGGPNWETCLGSVEKSHRGSCGLQKGDNGGEEVRGRCH